MKGSPLVRAILGFLLFVLLVLVERHLLPDAGGVKGSVGPRREPPRPVAAKTESRQPEAAPAPRTPGGLRGRTLDCDGHPVAGARVRVVWRTGPVDKDADGGAPSEPLF